jgi:hypothetical protein
VSEKIDAVRIEAMVNVLKTALPELVAVLSPSSKPNSLEFCQGSRMTNGAGSSARKTGDARGRSDEKNLPV